MKQMVFIHREGNAAVETPRAKFSFYQVYGPTKSDVEIIIDQYAEWSLVI